VSAISDKEKTPVMFTVQLKNQDTVQVSLEELEEFLEKNRARIQVQHKKMGKRRAAPVSSPQ
jgi:hypothetical protein